MSRKHTNAYVGVDVTCLSVDIAVRVELRKHNSTTYLYAQVGALLHRRGLNLTDHYLILVTQSGNKIVPHDVFGRYLTEEEKQTFLENAHSLGDQTGVALNVALTAIIQPASGEILPWWLIDAMMLQEAERHLARQDLERALAPDEEADTPP